jgi:hypothetical protein
VGFVVDKIVKCRGCLNELGYLKGKIIRMHILTKCLGASNALHLNLTALNVEDLNLNRSLIVERFHSPERYFAFLLLRHSGIDSSLKIIFRTCEKEPYILVSTHKFGEEALLYFV